MIAALRILSAAGADPLAGTFEGTSACEVKPSACRDEHVLYRFTSIKERSYRIDAYKLIGDKQVFMGPIEGRFDPRTGRLDGLLKSDGQPRGSLHLTLKGRHLSGTILLGDGTPYRLIEADKR